MIASEQANTGRQQTRLQYALFALLLIAAIALRLHEVGTVTLYSKDEVSYERLTSIAITQGRTGLQIDAARFIADPSLFDQPSPLRAGYVYAMVAVMWTTGGRDLRGLAYCSALLDGVSMCLLGMLAWKWLGPWRALAAMLLYAVSPPLIAMARRAWQEPAIACLGLLIIWAALNCVERREHSWALLLGTLAAFSFTIKETSFLDSCVVLTLVSGTLARERQWKQCVWLVASFTLALSACWLWLGFLLGGMSQPAYFLRESVLVSGSSSYAALAESGTTLNWLAMLWKGDPFLITLGALGAALAIAAWKRGAKPSRLLIWSIAITAAFLLLPALTANRLNLRFASPAFGPMCWLGAEALFAIDNLLQSSLPPRGRSIARLAMGMYLVVIGSAGVGRYRANFAARDMVDLSAAALLAPNSQEQNGGSSQ